MAMEEDALRDDAFTQLDVDQSTTSTSVHIQPADTGHDSDTFTGSSSSKDTKRVAYEKWLVETACVGHGGPLRNGMASYARQFVGRL
jgi:hypothetical protein